MLTLMVSLGVPMISGGDELGRTQRGNNNAYCHDSELTWTSWSLDDDAKEFLQFVQSVTALRRAQPVLRRDTFLQGRSGDRADVLWLTAEGREMRDADWADPERQTLGVLLDGRAIGEVDEPGRPITGDSLLVVLSAAARRGGRSHCQRWPAATGGNCLSTPRNQRSQAHGTPRNRHLS